MSFLSFPLRVTVGSGRGHLDLLLRVLQNSLGVGLISFSQMDFIHSIHFFPTLCELSNIVVVNLRPYFTECPSSECR
ncbi:unnamed protein product [Brugia timori]|uniref:Secreted protein n=1 Tax=Brugia timori TaxID=42155 RepID=A0A0R3Q7V7_9BILA|nr:unnamed protein product [Brugia timori]